MEWLNEEQNTGQRLQDANILRAIRQPSKQVRCYIQFAAHLGSLPLLVAVLVPAPLMPLPATLPAPPLPARLLLREEGPEGTAAVLVGATLRPLCVRGSGDTTLRAGEQPGDQG